MAMPLRDFGDGEAMTVPTHTIGETILKIQNVNVAYDGRPILRDLNAEIRNITRPDCLQGQVVALLAPSGMGKTTLFRILAGLEMPHSGQVLVEEKGVPVQRGMVGVVAQDYPLFEHRTVSGNLILAARMAGASAADASSRATELLKRFGLQDHGSKYPSQLSGGQRQRVAIAQQVLCSDHFLLMDEPFSGLDLLAIDAVIRLIGEIAVGDELKTIIIVTHDIGAAIEVADTIWLLGRDRDDRGNAIPGARIQKIYNLIERGLAWREKVSTTPEFFDVMAEIRQAFPLL